MVLRNRLKHIDHFPLDTVRLLDVAKAREHIRALADLRNKYSSADEHKRVFDARQESAGEVRSWLDNLPIDGEVVAIWLADAEGMSIPFRVFVNFYDDLWFPASDDVWITNSAFSFLLELSHEEIFTFYEVC